MDNPMLIIAGSNFWNESGIAACLISRNWIATKFSGRQHQLGQTFWLFNFYGAVPNAMKHVGNIPTISTNCAIFIQKGQFMPMEKYACPAKFKRPSRPPPLMVAPLIGIYCAPTKISAFLPLSWK